MRAATPLLLLLLLVLSPGCDLFGGGEGESIYDPDRQSLPDPSITDVSPSGSALAGIDVLTITGQNFSTTPGNNYVYFGTVRGTVIEATATMLRVLPPNTPGTGIPIRISVLGAENYSNTFAYELVNAAESVGTIARSEEVFGIASDGAGGALLSVFNEGASDDVQYLAPDGTRSVYFATTFPWSGLAVNTDGVLYGVRGIRAVFALPEGGTQATFGVAPTGFAFNAITSDDAGNLWVGGDHTSGAASRAIYRIAPDRSLTEFPFPARVRDLIVSDGFLWAVGRDPDGSSKVWRFPLSGGTLGTPEVVVTVFPNETGTAYALATAADGTLFIGTNANDPVLVWDGSALSPLYPGILTAPVTGLAWGEGSILYAVRGRTFDPGGELAVQAAVIAIETRRPGGASLL